MKVHELEPQQFCALLWAMSTFKIEMGNIIYNEAKEYIIREKAKIVIQSLEPDSLTSLAFALNNILRESSDLILEISKLVSKNIVLSLVIHIELNHTLQSSHFCRLFASICTHK